jgi:hypothetical protein
MVDVREYDEYKNGHAAGAKSLPIGELHRAGQILDKDLELLVICQSGDKSAKAAKILRSHGYKAVNVAGGTAAWSSFGLPMSK